ncbi:MULTISPECIES: acyl-CoA dehydrogenase family protein [Cupriavidus]|uniref:Acyl-CoA dehydrogenase n=1 Tax=Cupriavidus metallidurans TaxID=119219 RepID=A0A2L0X1L9_9BURK|nr:MULTISPECIES: acyl-CoA dehydrogenase family protein [Cupriavidus]AVA34003.1 acyl-CoA dehydrogenase [Cupriavidus metallidurans]KWR86878.1 acyl-CoA dehydrogenase [Cupriavidus sp. SHE]QBP12782.1 acyl-CoA dehydrogenase [Cupriavidus metallidurans]QWC90568.1 acyl-CoA dehydrogenase family protein [Cupriavidus metallidurans]
MGANLNPVFPALSLASIPPEDEALRAPVRAFLQDYLREMSPDMRARSWLGFDAAFSQALARQGWIGLTLPEEYGGAGRSGFARFVLLEELLMAGAPVTAHWIADRQTAPLILRFGSEAQRQMLIPKIVRGEAFVAIGMSEPDTGSDLASVRTRATRNNHGWLLNGRKVWTTNAHRSHYMIALVRTSGTPEDRHKGLSQVLIDLSLPGVVVRPIQDISGDAHFCEVLFEDVQLTEHALVGNEGDGWKQVTAELAFERSGPERIYSSIVLAQTWLDEFRASGSLHPTAVAIAGRMAGRLAVLRSMSLAVAAKLDKGERPDLEAALVKDLGTEFEQRVPGWIGEALDAAGTLPSAALMRTLAYVMQLSPSYSLRGGTREILRGIIARGLGLR